MQNECNQEDPKNTLQKGVTPSCTLCVRGNGRGGQAPAPCLDWECEHPGLAHRGQVPLVPVKAHESRSDHLGSRRRCPLLGWRGVTVEAGRPLTAHPVV